MQGTTFLLSIKVGLICCFFFFKAISPSDSCYGETLSTLRYADRAKNIINAPTVNEVSRSIFVNVRVRLRIVGAHAGIPQNVLFNFLVLKNNMNIY